MTVVIPVVDDAVPLRKLLADLAGQHAVDLQIIVVDGGSADASIAVAKTAGVVVLESERGRGRQMNTGAMAARGDWLCFLHADSRLTHPAQLRHAIHRLRDDSQTRLAGHFALCFSHTRSRWRFFYRFLEAKSATGRRYTINGDQGLLLHRDFFDALGGFDTRMAFLEDQRMAAAIEAHGRWCLLDHRLATSARRFEREGRARRYLLMALIMAMYTAGVAVFFERAPAVYARQADTQRLALMPYFRLLRQLMFEHGARACLATAWRIAGVALSQTWQLFFALDVALEPVLGTRGYLTGFHDRVLRPVLTNRVAQALCLVLVAAVVFGPIQLWFALRD